MLQWCGFGLNCRNTLLPIRPQDSLTRCKLFRYKVGFGVEGCSSFKKRSKK